MKELEVLNANSPKACLVCGDYLELLKEKKTAFCDYCGQTAEGKHVCSSGHFICDQCYAITTVDFVKRTCLKYKGTNPIELAVEIMNSPFVKMHGAEHHFIVPAVLLTCEHNYSGGGEGLPEKLDKAEDRATKETPRICSFKDGTCGAAVGTGVFLSMYLKHEQQDEDEWSLANKIIAESLKTVAESHGPRCCKRDTYLALQSTVKFLNDNFAINLPISRAQCTFSLRNQSCGREECTFYNLANSLV